MPQTILNEVKLTKSQKRVLNLLRRSSKKGMTPKRIIEELSYAPRTVRYALRRLLKLGLLKKVPNLQEDMRTLLYYVVG